MKYVIKNCPNCYSYGEQIQDYWCEFEHDNTMFTNPCMKSDCLLRQIVELCKHAKETGYFAPAFLADEILKMLEIEEVE